MRRHQWNDDGWNDFLVGGERSLCDRKRLVQRRQKGSDIWGYLSSICGCLNKRCTNKRCILVKYVIGERTKKRENQRLATREREKQPQVHGRTQPR
jgi:hypothetical protein